MEEAMKSLDPDLRARVRNLLGPYLRDPDPYRRSQPYAMAFEQIPRGIPENEAQLKVDQSRLAAVLDTARARGLNLPVPRYGEGLTPTFDRHFWTLCWAFETAPSGAPAARDPKALAVFCLEARIGLALMLAEQGIGPAALLVGTGAQGFHLMSTLAPFLPLLQAAGITLHYGSIGEVSAVAASFQLTIEAEQDQRPDPGLLTGGGSWEPLFQNVHALDEAVTVLERLRKEAKDLSRPLSPLLTLLNQVRPQPVPTPSNTLPSFTVGGTETLPRPETNPRPPIKGADGRWK